MGRRVLGDFEGWRDVSDLEWFRSDDMRDDGFM